MEFFGKIDAGCGYAVFGKLVSVSCCLLSCSVYLYQKKCFSYFASGIGTHFQDMAQEQ